MGPWIPRRIIKSLYRDRVLSTISEMAQVVNRVIESRQISLAPCGLSPDSLLPPCGLSWGRSSLCCAEQDSGESEAINDATLSVDGELGHRADVCPYLP